MPRHLFGRPMVPPATPAATGPASPPDDPGGGSARRVRGRPISSSLAPIRARDFGFEQARHLLWRAGFGGTPQQIQTLASWGPERSVDYLLNYDAIPTEDVKGTLFDRDIMRPMNAEERGEIARARMRGDEAAVDRLRAQRQRAEQNDREQMRKIQRWWLKRMIETPRPLEEKMTLFWHGHFATSYRTIEDSYHMFRQNDLFRRNATGNFGDLLFAIIRDPAMIAYLDNNDSRKGRPNENLARELMELFSLGVGNYTEQDIKEGARALTGYTFNDDEFVFQRNNHDDGPKVILGERGALDGDGFVRAILKQPACSRFMARKLYRFFAADFPTGRPEVDGPADAVIRRLAATMVSSRYAIRPVLRQLLLSEHFYEPALMNEVIKSPTELVVGAVRSLNTPVRDIGVLADALGLMGQNLFFPPSVKGWDGGRAWINTSTLYTRQNILCFLLTGQLPAGRRDALRDVEKYDPSDLLADLRDSGATIEPDAVADYVLRFTLGNNTPRNRETLTSFLHQHGGRITPETVTALLLLVTAMPEYQLC
ncbi:MAG: DUF1800 domain-containing protein [Phycisphaeraceae bacterium]|nr:DUF1800 domain-containing protein [Phycisphaeraceae bacterium]